MKTSSYLTYLHTQAFRKISQLVIFKLSSCDSSPPLKPVTGESSNDHKMSYTHPTSILSVSMGSRRQEEEMRKDPFWYFSDDQLWPFNFQPNISKMVILDFYSSDCKLKIVLESLGLGEDIVKKLFWEFHLRKYLWLFTSPEVEPWARDPREIFETSVFIF